MPDEPDVEAIRARVAAATPGPWDTNWRTGEVRDGEYGSSEDLEFIDHARTDVPDLLALVDRLQAALRAAAPTLRAVGDRSVQRLCHQAMPDLYPPRKGHGAS